MPIITIDGPKVCDLDRKREFAEKITKLVSEFYNIAPGAIVLLLKENAPENVASGGKLIIDFQKSSEEK
jgi:4-oxalocrotonate tautomerase family enzyme